MKADDTHYPGMTMTKTNTHRKTYTKTKTKCSKDPTYAIFLKSRWFKDITFDQTRVSSSLSRTFLELAFLF